MPQQPFLPSPSHGVDLPRGRKGTRLVHCVRLTIGDLTMNMLHGDILDLLAGQINAVEPLEADVGISCATREVWMQLQRSAGHPRRANGWRYLPPTHWR